MTAKKTNRKDNEISQFMEEVGDLKEQFGEMKKLGSKLMELVKPKPLPSVDDKGIVFYEQPDETNQGRELLQPIVAGENSHIANLNRAYQRDIQQMQKKAQMNLEIGLTAGFVVGAIFVLKLLR